MQKTIVYLIGYAGTGKYTIAKELAALTGAVLVDNHLINHLVFSGLGADGKTPLPASVWPKIESIRRIVLDTIAEVARPEARFLFTNVIYEGKPMDRRWYEDVTLLATQRQARLVPLILRCDPEELCRRVISTERAMRFKETSADRTREKMRTYQLFRVHHPNCLWSWMSPGSHLSRPRRQLLGMWKRELPDPSLEQVVRCLEKVHEAFCRFVVVHEYE